MNSPLTVSTTYRQIYATEQSTSLSYLVAHTMHLCGALLLFVFNVDDYRIPRNSNAH